MKYVFHALRMQWRCATQYRASFWMQTLAQLVMSGSELMAVLVLLGRFTSVGQWSGSEIMFFFGMMQMTFAITECVGRGLTAFSRVVQGGEFDQILLRPRNLLLQVLCSSTDPRRLSTAVLGIVLMWLSVTQLGIPWTLGSTVLLLISVAGTVLMLLGLFLVEATLCFLSVQSIEAVNILTYGGRTACEYPVDIYPRPIRLLFMYVAPFGLCMHVPVSALLHHPMVDWPAWTAYLAPLAGAMFFLLMALVWRKVGVKRYCSTGSVRAGKFGAAFRSLIANSLRFIINFSSLLVAFLRKVGYNVHGEFIFSPSPFIHPHSYPIHSGGSHAKLRFHDRQRQRPAAGTQTAVRHSCRLHALLPGWQRVLRRPRPVAEP